ncbi:hypothetical protein QJQ45_011885 [Haematococcus lacustris]|nr:hypothetical protein QJQ45_011885 [Haematococcus lacustris]
MQVPRTIKPSKARPGRNEPALLTHVLNRRGPVVASAVVEARLVQQIEARVKACTMRALLTSLLLGHMVRGCFTRVTALADGREAFDDIPAEDAIIPNLAELWRLCWPRGQPVERLLARPPIPLAQPRADIRAGGAHGVTHEGAVDTLAHLDADWLGCDPGKTNMATVALKERHPSSAVTSVWHRRLTAGQYYRQSGITEHAKTSKAWMADIKPQHDELSQVTTYTVSLQRYRQYANTVLANWPVMWAELSKPRWANARTVRGARVRCISAATGRPLALAYGAAGFSGSGSIGSRGVPAKQIQREACKQFPGRVVLVHEFRTSRVSSARTDVVAGQPESFRLHDRDVSAALNVRRIAAGPGRPRELSNWRGRPAMPNPGRPGQEWVDVRDKGLLRKWQRRHQRQLQFHVWHATKPRCVCERVLHKDGSLALLDAIDYVLKNEGTGGLPTDELVEGLASGDEDEPFSSRRKGGRRTSFLGGPCAHCGEADSPQWRRPANRNMACPSTVEPSSEARPPGSPAQPPLMADRSPSSPATVTRQAVQHKPALLAITSVAGNLPELHRTAPKPGCHSPVACPANQPCSSTMQDSITSQPSNGSSFCPAAGSATAAAAGADPSCSDSLSPERQGSADPLLSPPSIPGHPSDVLGQAGLKGLRDEVAKEQTIAAGVHAVEDVVMVDMSNMAAVDDQQLSAAFCSTPTALQVVGKPLLLLPPSLPRGPALKQTLEAPLMHLQQQLHPRDCPPEQSPVHASRPAPRPSLGPTLEPVFSSLDSLPFPVHAAHASKGAAGVGPRGRLRACMLGEPPPSRQPHHQVPRGLEALEALCNAAVGMSAGPAWGLPTVMQELQARKRAAEEGVVQHGLNSPGPDRDADRWRLDKSSSPYDRLGEQPLTPTPALRRRHGDVVSAGGALLAGPLASFSSGSAGWQGSGGASQACGAVNAGCHHRGVSESGIWGAPSLMAQAVPPFASPTPLQLSGAAGLGPPLPMSASDLLLQLSGGCHKHSLEDAGQLLLHQLQLASPRAHLPVSEELPPAAAVALLDGASSPHVLPPTGLAPQFDGLAVHLGSMATPWQQVPAAQATRRAMVKLGRPQLPPLAANLMASPSSYDHDTAKPPNCGAPPDEPRPTDWVPPEGEVMQQLLRPAWSLRHDKLVSGLRPAWSQRPDKYVRGLMWCHERTGESMQRPLVLRQWDPLCPPLARECQQRYKLVDDRLPKVEQRLHRAAEYRRGIDGRARNNP